jgi:hypothetical protein
MSESYYRRFLQPTQLFEARMFPQDGQRSFILKVFAIL